MPVSANSDNLLRVRLLRRWRICVVGLLVTIGLCAGAAILVPTTYNAKGLLLLTPPPTTTGPNAQVNPYLALSNLQPLADVLGRVITDPATVVALRAAGFSGSFTVVRDVSTNGPILDVAVNSSTSALAIKDLKLVLTSAAPALEKLQASESVAPASRATAQVFASDLKASASRKSQTRALLVAAALGLIGTVLGAVGVDNLALRRRRNALRADGADGTQDDLMAPKRPKKAPGARWDLIWVRALKANGGFGTGTSPNPWKSRTPTRPTPGRSADAKEQARVDTEPQIPIGPAPHDEPSGALWPTASGSRSAHGVSDAPVVAEAVVAEDADEPEVNNVSAAELYFRDVQSGYADSGDAGFAGAVQVDDLFGDFHGADSSELVAGPRRRRPLPVRARPSESTPPSDRTSSAAPAAVRPGVRALVRARMNGKRDLHELLPSNGRDADRTEVSVAAGGQGASPDG